MKIILSFVVLGKNEIKIEEELLTEKILRKIAICVHFIYSYF